MNYKNIQSTFVFNQLKDVVLDSIQGSLREGKVLSNVELEEQMMLIKKYINSLMTW